jgi:glutamyl-tRNA synthetase
LVARGDRLAAIRTRFAPSPTGDLHLGGAWTALASWVLARRDAGAVVLRVEDIDTARVVHGSQLRIEEDLRWLGLDWDEGPFLQSERESLYEAAIAHLAASGSVYPCDCSRAEITRVASAPHPGEEVRYPGLCRERDPARPMRRAPALRVRVPDEVVAYEDQVVGTVAQNLGLEVGDFVLRRGDGAFAYQLAVVVDDLAMGITNVVRGDDLVSSTPRQVWLARALGGEPPTYAHVPLVVSGRGARLEKRTQGGVVRALREAGVTAGRIVGELAYGLGLTRTNAPTSPTLVARACSDGEVAWGRTPWPIPASLSV